MQTRWTIDKQLETKDLHPTVAKFCSGLPVYRLKEITKENREMKQELQRPSRGKE